MRAIESADADHPLSFSVRAANDHLSLAAACQVRSVAYAVKNEAFRDAMGHPDAVDLSPATTVYLCRRKADGVPIGTMRIATASTSHEPLEIERYAGILPAYVDRRRAEITRLSAIPGADPYVRLALWKAAYAHAREHGVALIMVGARRPSLIRTYIGMGYRIVQSALPLPYAGGVPHDILAADLAEAESHWHRVAHPMLEFMLRAHPEISIATPLSVRDRPEKEVVRVL